MDKNLELLQSEIFKLPKERDESYFPLFLGKMFDKYLEKAGQFTGKIGEGIKENRSKSIKLIESLKRSLNYYYQGYPSKAFLEFKNGVDGITDLLWKQKRDILVAGSRENLFRVRKKSKGGNVHSKADMFHVPFQDRFKISTQRYSIPGFPCLYLGNSVYTCCVELGINKTEDLEEMSVVRVDASKYKFLEMSMSPSWILRGFEGSFKRDGTSELFDDFVIYLISVWPLIAACSTKVMRPPDEKLITSHFFKPEYIFPQMLLEWVRMSEDLDGIKYFSSHNNLMEAEYDELINYAIPVKIDCPNGQCPQLIHDLPITDPISYKSIVENNPSITNIEYSNGAGDSDKKGEYRLLGGLRFLKIKDKRVWYIDTIYGKLEFELLKNMTPSQIIQ